MSPTAAAVEFQSPFTSKLSPNPNSNPNFDPCSSSGDHLYTQPYTSSSSSTAFSIGVGVGRGTGSQTGSVRSKPRLVKLRKQMGRSRNGASEMASDFNPFASKGEDSGSVNGNSYKSVFSSNGVSENTNSVSNEISFENDNMGFVFGAKKSDKPFSDDHGQREIQSEIEPEEVKANEVRFRSYDSFSRREDCGKGAFIFGADNEKSFGNEKSIRQIKNGNVDPNLCNEGKFVSESSSSSNNMVGAPSTVPAFKLLDEMKKLNINKYENDDGYDKKYDSDKNSCTHADGKFVFTSGAKPSSSFTVDSNPIHEQISDVAAAVGTKVEDKCGSGDRYRIVFGNNCNRDSASSANDFVPEATSSENNYVPKAPSAVGTSFTEFVTPLWDPSCFKANLCPKLNGKLEFSAKSKSIKDKILKKTRGKLKQPSFLKQGLKQVYVQKEGNLQENPNSPECYSPMDFSPYVETTVSDITSRETLVTINESFHRDTTCATSTSSHSVTTDSKDGNISSVERFNISMGDQNCRQSDEKSFGSHSKSSQDGYFSSKWFVFGSGTAYSSFNREQVCSSSGFTGPSMELADGLNTKIPENLQYCFDSGAEGEKYFAFSASSTKEGGLTTRRRLLRKKNKKKVGNESFIISPRSNVKVSSSFVHGQEEDRDISKGETGTLSELAEQIKQGFISSNASFQEACEMWRQRGNQAYKNGNLSKAEDFYTQGINSAPPGETAGCRIKPLLLCYSNRAATKISLGRMREAIEDCLIAANIDSSFLKVYVRAANCHLLLGEVENALHYYNKALESGPDVCLDRRITIEAAEGLQKAKKVAESTNCSAKLLEQKTSQAISDALEIIVDALSISSCSEKLLEMKAEALYMLRKYQEAIQLCEQTLDVAEKNFASVETDNGSVDVNASGSIRYSPARLWRWHFISKSHFCLGNLEAALDLLQNLEQLGSLIDKHEMLESSISLAATIRDLLCHKNAGNEAFRSGRYTEAVEHYTTALSSSIESRPFAAICFCNRAAALQALGQIADAISDCSLAMALDGNYTKAVSRRAVLHEMIRDYVQAATDLKRLVSILENRSNEKAKQSGSPSKSTGSKEIRHPRHISLMEEATKKAHRHISLMEEAAKKAVRLDLYLILGVKASDAASDIKKAFRKAALRHHPDKAGQFLVRTESGEEGRLWKEIGHEVHKDADRLFKMIGEAYAVLSDPNKRSQYDLEEEIMTAPKESHRSSSHGRQSDAYGSSHGRRSDAYGFPSRRSGNKKYW